MIKNERQYRITKAQADKFVEAISRIEEDVKAVPAGKRRTSGKTRMSWNKMMRKYCPDQPLPSQ